jgi:hypothetical protein
MRMILSASVLALAVALGGAAPAGASYRNCRIGDATSYGPTYVTSLAANHVSCAKARRVVRAFHRCRKANGGTDGRCRHRVLRFRCSEQRGSGRGQFTGKVVCRRGTARVRHTYTQFT